MPSAMATTTGIAMTRMEAISPRGTTAMKKTAKPKVGSGGEGCYAVGIGGWWWMGGV